MIPSISTPTFRSGAWAALALAVGTLVGCGGGSSSPASKPRQAPAITGVWSGTSQSQAFGAGTVNGVITAGGQIRSLSSNNVQVNGTVTVSGNTVTGTATLLAPAGSAFNNGNTSAQVTLTGTASGSTVNLSYTGDDTGSITLANQAPTALATFQPNTLAGSYTAAADFTSSGLETTANIDASGAITGGDANGAVQGQLTQLSAGLDAFSVALTYTPTGSGPLTYNGLAFYRSAAMGASTPCFVFMLSDAAGEDEFAGVFTLNAGSGAAVSIAGVWKGTSQSQTYGAGTVGALITADGQIRGLTSNLDQINGRLAVSGTAVIGTATLIAPTGDAFNNGNASAQVILSGTLSGSSLTLNYTGDDTGSVTLSLLTPGAQDTFSFSALQGTYTAASAFTSSGLQTTATVSATGALTGGDANGKVVGQLTPVPPGGNAFTVALTYTPKGGQPIAFTGLAYYLTTAMGATTPTVVVMVSDNTGDDEFAGLFNM